MKAVGSIETSVTRYPLLRVTLKKIRIFNTVSDSNCTFEFLFAYGLSLAYANEHRKSPLESFMYLGNKEIYSIFFRMLPNLWFIFHKMQFIS